MSVDPSVTLYITFRVPPSLQFRPTQTRHQRQFDNVPESVAEKIVNDFERYSNGNSSVKEEKLYRYVSGAEQGEEKEILLPIDFGEVLSLSVVARNETVDRTPPASRSES